MQPSLSSAFQRHQEHDLKHPVNLITTNQLPSFIDRWDLSLIDWLIRKIFNDIASNACMHNETRMDITFPIHVHVLMYLIKSPQLGAIPLVQPMFFWGQFCYVDKKN
jgi:hypothetical protein